MTVSQTIQASAALQAQCAAARIALHGKRVMVAGKITVRKAVANADRC